MKLTLTLLALLASTQVFAASKCVGSDGKVTYQDAPCSVGATSSQLGPKPSVQPSYTPPPMVAAPMAPQVVVNPEIEKLKADVAKFTAALNRPKPPDNNSTPAQKAAAEKACNVAIKTTVQWKDSGSLRFSQATRQGMMWSLNNPQNQVVRYIVPVNAKNSYGAYAGDKNFMCELDPNEKTVLSVFPQ